MVARINPDRALTNAEKARRHRDNHAAYVRALELALVDAEWSKALPSWWHEDHSGTVATARRSLAQYDG